MCGSIKSYAMNLSFIRWILLWRITAWCVFDTTAEIRYIQWVISGFFKLVFYIIVAYIVYLIIRFVFTPQRRTRSARPPRRLAGTMVKDESCNTYLPREDALREIVDGKEYFFCSQDCRRKFLEQRKSGE